MSHWKETNIILISSLIILAPILMAGQVVAADQLVVNGGFETGDLTGWTPLRALTGASVTTAQPHTGTYSLELRNTDSVEQNFQPAVSTGGDLTFWLKCPSPGCGPLVVFVFYSDGSQNGLELEGGAEVSVDWARFAVSVDNSKQVTSVKFVYVPFLSGVFFLDDVSLPAVASPKTWDGGGGDSNWSNELNWNDDILPSGSDDIIIDGDPLVVSFVTLDIAFTLTATGTLNVEAGDTLAVSATGSLTNQGTFTNDGTFTNSGDFIITATGIFTNFGDATNTGTCTNDGTFTNKPGSTFVNFGVCINNAGNLINESGATINNLGSIINGVGDTITNFGVITTTGSITNDGTFANEPGGVINIDSGGSITNNVGATISNLGVFITNPGSTFTNFGTLVGNTPLTVDSIAAPIEPVTINTIITATATFTDPDLADSHTALWDWGDGTTTGPVSLTVGSRTLAEVHTYTQAGVFTVSLTVSDGSNEGSAQFQFVVVYDPEGGFVTGGGWIDSPAGAFTADPSLEGKATFGFVSKYKKGADVPTGNTEFQFKVADLNFHSDTFDWLVIAGPQAKFKGTGTINGEGNFGFMLSATDGDINGGGGADKFRIKIWDKDTGEIIYDNKLGADDDADPTTQIQGGSIVIHNKKK